MRNIKIKEKLLYPFQSEKDPEKQMTRLLDMIPKRGPEAYEKFMEALKPDYPWIVENFKDREEDMKAKGTIMWDT